MRYDPACEFSRQSLALSLISELESRGFSEETQDKPIPKHPHSELVYSFPINQKLSVRIFTSAVRSKDYGLTTREVGQDTIRVDVVTPGGDRPIVSEIRVKRTGVIDDIIERTFEKARDAYRIGRRSVPCRKCGAQKALSKSKKWYCSAVCWKSDEEKAHDKAEWRARKRRNFRRW